MKPSTAQEYCYLRFLNLKVALEDVKHRKIVQKLFNRYCPARFQVFLSAKNAQISMPRHLVKDIRMEVMPQQVEKIDTIMFQHIEKFQLQVHNGHEFRSNRQVDGEILGKQLKNLENLSEFEFILGDFNNLNEDKCENIFKCVQQMEKLQNLSLEIGRGNEIKPEGCKKLGNCLQNLINLKQFSLNIAPDNEIQNEGCKYILNLKNSQKLEKINIYIQEENEIQNDGIQALFQNINTKGNNINHIQFKIGDQGYIDHFGWKQLGNSIKQFEKLRKLEIWFEENCEIGFNGIQGLFEQIFEGNTLLQCLRLRVDDFNEIGVEGVRFMVENFVKKWGDIQQFEFYIGMKNGLDGKQEEILDLFKEIQAKNSQNNNNNNNNSGNTFVQFSLFIEDLYGEKINDENIDVIIQKFS